MLHADDSISLHDLLFQGRAMTEQIWLSITPHKTKLNLHAFGWFLNVTIGHVIYIFKVDSVKLQLIQFEADNRVNYALSHNFELLIKYNVAMYNQQYTYHNN